MMEEKQQVILLLLLVTMSSVMGVDFTFSRKAYEDVINLQRDLGVSFTVAEPIEFLNMAEYEELVVAPDEEVEEAGMPQGIYMTPKNRESVQAGISEIENQKPQSFSYMSLVFTKIPHPTRETSFGNLLICFEDFKNSPSDKQNETCMMAFMFSTPKTLGDQKYAAAIAEELNPLSEGQVKSILGKESFNWSLSSLKKALLSGIKRIEHIGEEGQSAFALKPIIVDENLLKQYFNLANPNGFVEEEGKRRAIFSLLLVTLSSVMGLDFSFSKESYNAILHEEKKVGVSVKVAERITFVNMDHEEALSPASDDELETRGVPPGIHIAPKDRKAVKSGISGAENQITTEPQRMHFASIVFSKLSHDTGVSIFGNLLICFEEFINSPTESCLRAFLFSPPKTEEDKKYAKKIAVKLDPLSQDQVDAISKNTSFKWSLTSLKELLQGGLKKYVYTPDEGQSVFALKPIIVSEKLMKQYFNLANPSHDVEEVAKFRAAHLAWSGSVEFMY